MRSLTIGYLARKGTTISKLGQKYLEEIAKYKDKSITIIHSLTQTSILQLKLNLTTHYTPLASTLAIVLSYN